MAAAYSLQLVNFQVMNYTYIFRSSIVKTYLWNQVDWIPFSIVLIGKQHVVMWYGEPPDAPNQFQSRSLPKLNAVFRDSQAIQT